MQGEENAHIKEQNSQLPFKLLIVVVSKGWYYLLFWHGSCFCLSLTGEFTFWVQWHSYSTSGSNINHWKKWWISVTWPAVDHVCYVWHHRLPAAPDKNNTGNKYELAKFDELSRIYSLKLRATILTSTFIRHIRERAIQETNMKAITKLYLVAFMSWHLKLQATSLPTHMLKNNIGKYRKVTAKYSQLSWTDTSKLEATSVYLPSPPPRN